MPGANCTLIVRPFASACHSSCCVLCLCARTIPRRLQCSRLTVLRHSLPVIWDVKQIEKLSASGGTKGPVSSARSRVEIAFLCLSHRCASNCFYKFGKRACFTMNIVFFGRERKPSQCFWRRLAGRTDFAILFRGLSQSSSVSAAIAMRWCSLRSRDRV